MMNDKPIRILSMGEPEPLPEIIYHVIMTILCRDQGNATRVAVMVTRIMALLDVPGMVTVVEQKPVEVPPAT